jgi:Protein of unknown function (DUF1552)
MRMSRRTVLRGIGVTLTLPWMESLNVAATGVFPKRFAVLFMGNGINGNHWWAKGSGDALTLSRTLAPLAPLGRKIIVIDGLFNKPGVGRGIHAAQTRSVLSGAPIQERPIVRAGITVDQAIAREVGRETPLRSLVLACEPAGDDDSHLSWQRADSPAPCDVDPARAFDRLFDTSSSLRPVSILDRVKDSAAALARSIARPDRATLDEYLTTVREVERRVDCIRNRTAATPAPCGVRLQADLDAREHTRLMCDIVSLAFQTDRTRVASLVLAGDRSSLRYPFLDVPGDHHAASHDDLSDGYERICRFHVSRLAYLAGKLDAMREGDATVLDRTCLLWLSNMWSGWKHDNMKLPVVLAGGLGGTLPTGRALDYLQAGDDQRKLCSLYLSIMDRMGVAVDRFGDADAPLAGL